MKKTALIIICILIIAAAVAVCAILFYRSSHMQEAPGTPLPTKEISVGTTTLTVELATTQAQQAQGLGGRASLPDNHGMLFVFNADGDWGIWMKDMAFPIDILFISENGYVVSVDPDISPDTYDTDPPQIFYPPLAVRYVLELPAGYAAAHGIEPDSKFDLSSI
jgi:uncharacterized membrane protein (UPF0127 family)